VCVGAAVVHYGMRHHEAWAACKGAVEGETHDSAAGPAAKWLCSALTDASPEVASGMCHHAVPCHDKLCLATCAQAEAPALQTWQVRLMSARDGMLDVFRPVALLVTTSSEQPHRDAFSCVATSEVCTACTHA
jgi:hypothetical protein